MPAIDMPTKPDLITPLSSMAFNVLRTLIKHAGNASTFKGMFTMLVGEEEVPVLILGIAHYPIEDGQAIAVLNPDPDLQEELHAGTAYLGGLLKEIVSGKCDAMVHVWLDAYKNPEIGETIIGKYVSRKRKQPKYEVR
jgi:hypothetical protein